MNEQKTYTRKRIRFKPGDLEVAFIEFGEPDADKPFRPHVVAYIDDMSPMGGCALVMHQKESLAVGLRCRIKLGPLAPLAAECVHKVKISPTLIRLGFRFLE